MAVMMRHEPMTPAWSHQLAIVVQSPYFQGSLKRMTRRERFVDQATQYAAYEDMPRRLQAIYDRALRMLQEG